MTLTHFPAMLLFAAVISVAFAFLTRRTLSERLRYTVWSFSLFLFVALAAAWLMYFFFR